MKQLIIRKCGPTSLQITLPYRFVDEFSLQPGDTCFWCQEGNEVRLRFSKAQELSRASELMGKLKAAIAEGQPEPENAA
jgi:hypothetical protein